MKPKCYNRPDYGNYLLQDGWDGDRRVMVEVPFAMSQGCKSWAADTASDPVPLMDGWQCAGCRHYPAEDVKAAIRNARMRAKT
jgi:hypothetical protein